MKKFLFTVFISLLFCIPAFSAESVFIQNITKDQAQKAIISSMIFNNWQVGNESEHYISFYRTESSTRAFTHEYTAYDIEVTDVQFTFLERENGVILAYNSQTIVNPNTPNAHKEFASDADYEISRTIRDLFFGSYNYNIKYKIKKDYVLITDNEKTYFEGNKRTGKDKKIAKINDRYVSQYKKSDLKKLFNDCKLDKIKLEADVTAGGGTYYLLRRYTEPTYKYYL